MMVVLPKNVPRQLLAATGLAGLGPGFFCATTHRTFDGDLATPWQEAGKRLALLLEQEQGKRPAAVALAAQVHGADVCVVDPGPGDGPVLQMPHCDGLVTARAGVALAVRTADCLPVVAVDPEARICGVFHAGWRGSLGNITGEGIGRMKELGADPGRMLVWIGPGISGRRYEVSAEMIADFAGRWGHLGCFHARRMLDLPVLNALQARAQGVGEGRVSFSGFCTWERDDLFWSHRRDGRKRGHLFTICGFQ